MEHPKYQYIFVQYIQVKTVQFTQQPFPVNNWIVLLLYYRRMEVKCTSDMTTPFHLDRLSFPTTVFPRSISTCFILCFIMYKTKNSWMRNIWKPNFFNQKHKDIFREGFLSWFPITVVQYNIYKFSLIILPSKKKMSLLTSVI